MKNRCKYFMQVDTGFSYQSELIEISKESFDTECYKCNRTVEKNNDTCFKRECIDEFDNRIQTEYTYGIGNMCIYLIKLECKEGYKFIKSKSYYEVQICSNDKTTIKKFKTRVEVLKYYDEHKNDGKQYIINIGIGVDVVKK